jgi:hypothetical protein
MPTTRFNRRTVLRGVLATGATMAIPLPILEIMLNGDGTAFAQGAPLPRRYCTWFFGNGILPPLWNPASTAADWTLSEELAPLANVKDWLTVVSGLKQPVASGMPHPTGSAVATTGADYENNSAALPSIDQIIAGLNKGGSFPSLEIGVSDATPNGPQNTLHAISHRGPNAPNYPEFDPHALFTRIFAGRSNMTATTVDQIAKLNQAKKSILDAVLADGAEVKKRLGAKDQARLSDHLDAIRQIETRLQMAPLPTTVKLPSDPQAAGIAKDAKSEAPVAVNEVMAEMLAVAFASDITRNASFVFTLPAAHVFYRSLGSDMNDDFHDTICHGDPGDNASQPRVHRGVIYAMEALSVFAGKLAALTEGAGTVLDNSLIYVTSCTSWGKVHDTSEWPVLLVGKASGALSGNQHYRAMSDHIVSEVLLTIANIFGAGLATLGNNDARATSELTGVRIS